jgi:hypothetical protein
MLGEGRHPLSLVAQACHQQDVAFVESVKSVLNKSQLSAGAPVTYGES